MDDLQGSANGRLAQLDSVVASGEASPEWLIRQLRQALMELADVEPVADAEQDRREDY